MVRHPLTDKGIKQFREDWDKAREAAQNKPEAKEAVASGATQPGS
jgi:hypothetical protein